MVRQLGRGSSGIVMILHTGSNLRFLSCVGKVFTAHIFFDFPRAYMESKKLSPYLLTSQKTTRNRYFDKYEAFCFFFATEIMPLRNKKALKGCDQEGCNCPPMTQKAPNRKRKGAFCFATVPRAMLKRAAPHIRPKPSRGQRCSAVVVHLPWSDVHRTDGSFFCAVRVSFRSLKSHETGQLFLRQSSLFIHAECSL